MAKYCIIGQHGFIGNALAKRLKNVTSVPTKDCDIIFDFGSPVHPPFQENPDYYFKTLLERHLYFLSFGVYYVWPSSALVYEDRPMAFTYFKRAMEEIAKAYPNNLGLRIFPAYGEGDKRTFIYQACTVMKEGRQPEIWGDGKQTRNFVFIDDLVDEIIELTNSKVTGIRDIGVHKQVSFNEVVKTINTILHTKIQPIYKDLPKDYFSHSPICRVPLLQYTSLYDGIKKILGQ